MKLTILVSLLLAALQSRHAIAAHTGQVAIDSLIGDSWDISDSATGEECTVSRSTAFEQVAGHIDFSESATQHLDEPRLSALNTTSWEQWEFDGTASDGMSGIVLGFSRDASYAFFGQGNLRVEFYMILGDGTTIQDLDYVDESIITSCVGHVTGVWQSKTRTYGFRVSRDMSRAEAWWKTRRSKGKLRIDSDTPPGLADGSLWLKSPAATAELAPKLYMSHPIPGGRIVAEHSVGSKRMSFEGRGAHTRIWAKDSWFQICDGWNTIRAFVGPYTVMFWQAVSRIRKGVPYYSALLFKDGELLVGTSGVRNNETGTPEDEDADYVTLTHNFGGTVTGTMADRATGHYVEFGSGGKTWRFLAEHKRRMFDMSMGDGLGLSGFTTRVTGGEVGGGEMLEGFGWSEQVALPIKIKKWQIWIVYGIGLLGEWKHTLFNVFQKFLGSS